MMEIKAKYNNQTYTFPKDTTLLEIGKNFKKDFKYEIIVGSVNNKLTELSHKLEKDADVTFYDLSSLLGNRVYERGLIYLYIKAVKDIMKCDVIIEHSIDRGIYTEVVSESVLTDNDIINIKNRMSELVNLSIPFEKLSVSRIETIDYYEANKQFDKAEAMKYISNTYVNLYRLDDIYDYLYGEMPINTSYLSFYDLTKVSDKGVVLRFPNIYLDSKIVPYKHHDKLFEEFGEYKEWSNRSSLNNVSDLNKIISTGDVDNLIYMCETEQNNRLMDIAETISKEPKIKIVLIAGPSSSGKTTTSKKLALYLQSIGLKPHAISIDDYFFDRDKTPKKDNGESDFESIKSIDTILFNDQLKRLLNNEKVILREYDFISGTGKFGKNELQIDGRDVLIIEGLHALNDELTSSIDGKTKYKIYISPLTNINLDNHNRISMSDNRLLRRMIRDNRMRGYTANMTLSKWQGVREGEEKYVFPYQDSADVIFNTSLLYELGVLRLYAEPLLFSVSEKDPYYGEAIRLINVLRNVLPTTSDDIPLDSILREFIGNSYFEKEATE